MLSSSIAPSDQQPTGEAATYADWFACLAEPVRIRERIAQLNGIWHDTILIERRSPVR